MGREFARLSVELSNEYDLSSGLDDSSLGVNSASFHGPRGSDTDISSAFSSLNSIASNNTKYTIIDIVDNGGDSGGGATVKYLLDPVAVFIGAPADDKWISYDIPADIPSDAAGIIVRFEARADQGTFSVQARTTSWNERRVCLALADAPGNISDGASDVNTFVMPYSSTIDVQVDHNGTGDARFYVDGYIAGGSGGGDTGGGGTGGEVIAYGTITEKTDTLFNATVSKYNNPPEVKVYQEIANGGGEDAYRAFPNHGILPTVFRTDITITDLGPTGKANVIAVSYIERIDGAAEHSDVMGYTGGGIVDANNKTVSIFTSAFFAANEDVVRYPRIIFHAVSLPADS